MIRNGLLVWIFVMTAHAAEKKERWIYVPANFQVDAEVTRVTSLLERAAALGFRYALIQDSKFAHLTSVSSTYRPNVEKVKAAASKLHIELVPALFPVGYSNDLLFNDPNLAEGLPVKDASFVVKNGVAEISADPPVSLPSTKTGWDFVDQSLVEDGGAFRSGPTAENSRLHKQLKVAPFRQYHLSATIRTEALGGGKPEIKALTRNGRGLQWSNIAVKPTQDWTRCDVTFNSLTADEVGIYFGIWGGHQGTAWWRDLKIEECGPVNLLRRPGAPLVVRREDGTPLAEGINFEPFTDALTGTKPYAGSYTAWHEGPRLRTKNLPDGTKLLVSYFHTQVIYDEQVCGCVEEPAFQKLLRKQATDVVALWGSKTNFMSHDEWRVLGWDPSCGGESPGKIAADNLRFCTGLLRDRVPGGRILVWNDMFDPFHNAKKDYYLVNGSLEGSWLGLTDGVEIMNWNFDHRAESLAFFEKLGHNQIVAGFYDGDLKDVSAWLKSADSVPGVRGFMYTTWRQDFSQLEKVTAILDRAGW
jgi:hypothetical protein